ncbi:DUF6491 family protein [Kordiimonas sp.]|uniref:DUF6491 family protein n=1 Tax=Kordiimonas sp. TaxID=1970157 RepID=UPI003A93C2F0
MLIQKHLIIGSALLGSSISAAAQDAETEERTEAAKEDMRCISTRNIQSYEVQSDEVVRFKMQGTDDILVRLKRSCPQLHYHGYISYQPVNGQLCARIDDLVSRAGTPCRIDSFSKIPHGSARP